MSKILKWLPLLSAVVAMPAQATLLTFSGLTDFTGFFAGGAAASVGSPFTFPVDIAPTATLGEG